jgi:hypothetical protein
MSNQMSIIAALCAKANDAAFANEISIAADRCPGQEDPTYNEDNPAVFIAGLCVKASVFHLEDHCLDPSALEATKEPICPSVSNNGHKIANLHPESLSALLKCCETMATDDDSRQDERTRHIGSTTACQNSIEGETSASSLTDVERQNVEFGLKQAQDFTPKPHHGMAIKKHKRRSSKAADYTADVVAAALSACQEAPEKSRGTAKGGKRTGRSSGSFDVTTTLLEESPKKKGTRRLSSSLRKKLDIPKCSFDGSTHSPTGDEIPVFEECSIVTNDAESVPSDDDLKVIGWRKALDPASGNYYYYTIDRSKVVWDSPLVHN